MCGRIQMTIISIVIPIQRSLNITHLTRVIYINKKYSIFFIAPFLWQWGSGGIWNETHLVEWILVSRNYLMHWHIWQCHAYSDHHSHWSVLSGQPSSSRIKADRIFFWWASSAYWNCIWTIFCLQNQGNCRGTRDEKFLKNKDGKTTKFWHKIIKWNTP